MLKNKITRSFKYKSNILCRILSFKIIFWSRSFGVFGELINENLRSIEQYLADVIEFHAAANNHVFQQFYSPHFSKRKDNWLVYTEKRINLSLQVIDLWSKFIE